jgi:GT2 family glycosyltransferase
MRPLPDPDFASVVVALNPHDHALGPVMDAWATQRGAGDFEVIVVDDGSRASLRDEHAAHRARFPSTPVRMLHVTTLGRAASNNAGVGESRGAVVMFVADDFRPAATLVAAHRRFHALGATPAVGIGPGFWDAHHRRDPFRRWMEDSGSIFGMAFPTAWLQWNRGFFYVGNASMPRAIFDAVGPFDERYRYDMCDDLEWSMRLQAAGIPTHYVSRAIAWHDHGFTIDDRVETNRKLGEAARIYESTMPPPWPWSAMTSQPIDVLEAEWRDLTPHGDPEAIGERARRWKSRDGARVPARLPLGRGDPRDASAVHAPAARRITRPA